MAVRYIMCICYMFMHNIHIIYLYLFNYYFNQLFEIPNKQRHITEFQQKRVFEIYVLIIIFTYFSF